MIALLTLLAGGFVTAVAPPEPFGPVPTPQQMAWQRMEFGMFCHFGINTFHNEEWTDGTKDPKTFLPTAFKGRQWVETAKEAGMGYLIVTAKHHDGFSVYPTEEGDYNVKASPWREGKGDVLREVADACHELGLMLGVYLSPWDRHDPLYANPPAYDTRFKTMLKELLTWYAPVGEVWFDGAGSEGHVYDWNGYYALIREVAPDALIAICGPDIRWVGNEDGLAPDTLWNVHEVTLPIPGSGGSNEKRWYPSECDVPIRKGQWFYHTDGESNLRSVRELLDIYYRSVGLGASLLLNVSPDRRGLLPDPDRERLLEVARILASTFHYNMAVHAHVSASNVRGNDKEYAAGNVTDNNPDTYWTVNDGVLQASLLLRYGSDREFDRVMLQEHLPLGQRVTAHEIQVYEAGGWKTVASGTTVGYKRIHRLPLTKASRIRIQITDALAPPAIEAIGLYKASVGENTE